MTPFPQESATPEIFNRQQAADFLGVSLATIKHHVFYRRDLHPFHRKPLLFTRQELERYRATPHPNGRPPKLKAAPPV